MSGDRTTTVTIFGSELLATFALVAIVFCVFAAGQAAALECEIRATATSGTLQLAAVAKSPEIAVGNYRFEILKDSPTGSSQNVQSGTFEVTADRETTLSTTVLDGSARGYYRAKLTLSSQTFGSVSCVSP